MRERLDTCPFQACDDVTGVPEINSIAPAYSFADCLLLQRFPLEPRRRINRLTILA